MATSASALANLLTTIPSGAWSFVGGLFGVYLAATLAMKNWREQRVKQHGHEICFDVVQGLLRIRNMFRSARNPFVISGQAFEIASRTGENLLAIEDLQARSVRCTQIIYEERYRHLAAAMIDLDGKCIAAEVYLGGDVNAKLAKIRSCVNRVGRSIEAVCYPNGGHSNAYILKQNQILYGSLDDDDKDDVFGQEISNSINSMIALVTPHLIRPQRRRSGLREVFRNVSFLRLWKPEMGYLGRRINRNGRFIPPS